jgi:hypothetical protein
MMHDDQLTASRQHAWRNGVLNKTNKIVCESSNSNGLVSQSTGWRFSHDRVASWSHADCID